MRTVSGAEIDYSANVRTIPETKPMFTNNPFADIPAFITSSMMQTYVIVMILLVTSGTIYDVLHKKSARYFWENRKKSKAQAPRDVGAGETVTLAIKLSLIHI